MFKFSKACNLSSLLTKKGFCKTVKANDNIFTYLNERNLISNISNQDLIKPEFDPQERLGESPRMYIGFDPTAESLHLGNLIGILNAIRFGAYGIDPILLIGGATGLIGDPSGKNKERPLLQKEVLEKNIEGIQENIAFIFNNIKSSADFKTFYSSKSKNREAKMKLQRDTSTSKVKNNSNNNFDKLKAGIFDGLSGINPLYINNKIFQDKNYEHIHPIDYNASSDKLMQIKYDIINNSEFYKDLSVLDFLREAGTNLRMGPLLSRETVKNRISSKEGLSLCEFMYQSFQGYDYLKLYENYNARIQIGGSDQWGNMLAGYELIKKIKNTEVVNMTFPLMTTANGQKFGKSEGNACFINPKLTPINSIYQYFYNVSDADLDKLFSAFTFIEKEEIDDILLFHSKKPQLRTGQINLAEKVVGLLYSEEEANKCKKNIEMHHVKINDLASINIEEHLKDCNVTQISEDCLNDNLCLSKLCVDHKIFDNRAQCKRMIQQGSILVNDSKIDNDVIINKDILKNGRFIILKAGKKNTHIFEIKAKEIAIQDKDINILPRQLELNH